MSGGAYDYAYSRILTLADDIPVRESEKQAVAASVTVYRVADMTAEGRKAVCSWLRKLADDLQNEPEAFAKTLRARYMYPSDAGAASARREFKQHLRRVAEACRAIEWEDSGDTAPDATTEAIRKCLLGKAIK